MNQSTRSFLPLLLNTISFIHIYASGWITHIDPYGWFQWYCRFYQGKPSPAHIQMPCLRPHSKDCAY